MNITIQQAVTAADAVGDFFGDLFKKDE